ncbi:MAG: hypothetical protein CMO55_10335 [Verrucomicrobiales bacterium]|nr:hypothetical protein [Verrucomicrobiales bacterium]
MKKAPKFVRVLRTTTPFLQAISLLLVAVSLIYSHIETSLIADQLAENRKELEATKTANKRMYTFDLLGDLSENGDLADANFAMVKLINKGARVTTDKNGLPTVVNEDGSPSTLTINDRDLVALLNYYELLGTAWKNNTIDEALLFHVRGGPIKRAHGVCEEYIRKRGKKIKAPNLYENFRLMAAKVDEQEGMPDK